MYFGRRRPDQRFRGLAILFGAFIALCGTTHALDVWTLWVPDYGIQAVAKVLTALVSVATAIALWGVMPAALTLPTHRDLELKNEELRESEERYRVLFVDSKVPMLLIDPATEAIVEANRAACDFYGYDAVQFKRLRITDLNQLPPAQIEEEIAAAEREHRSHFLFPHRLADGSMRDVEVHSGPIQLRGRHLLYSIIHDITERREIEGRLRDSEERFRTTFEQAATGFIHTSFEGKFLRSNRKFCDIIGYTPDETANLTYQQITHPDDLDTSILEVAAMRSGGIGSACWEKRYIRKDGSVAWVRLTCSVQSDVGGAPLHLITVVEDIAAQKKAEAALVRERDFIQSVIDSLPGIFYVVREGDGFDLWNRNFEVVTGYTADEIARLSAGDLFEGDDKDVIRQRIGLVFAVGEADAEASIVTKTGRRIPHYLSGRRMISDDGARLVGMGIDISGRKALEEELRRSNGDLEHFAYVASHDLRQPLRMVSSYLTLLERRYAGILDEEGREYIGHARDGAVRMDRLIVDLLEYSRIGRHGHPPEALDLGQVTAEAARNLEALIEETGCRIEIAVAAAPITGNKTELVRLFQNLIGNAMKYRTSERRPQVEVGWQRQSGEWLVSVKDNGIGIAPEFLQDVFTIFRRLHSVRDYEGTGIGLAVCLKIVQRHGGRIWAESTVGEGSTFHFTLPAG